MGLVELLIASTVTSWVVVHPANIPSAATSQPPKQMLQGCLTASIVDRVKPTTGQFATSER